MENFDHRMSILVDSGTIVHWCETPTYTLLTTAGQNGGNQFRIIKSNQSGFRDLDILKGEERSQVLTQSPIVSITGSRASKIGNQIQISLLGELLLSILSF